MPNRKNPFIAGNWVRGENFFGRDDRVREILDGKYRYVWIAGTRRIGKTSLLKELELRCGDAYLPLFWNMQGAGDAGGLAELLLESVEDAEDRFAESGVAVAEMESLSLFEMLRYLKKCARQSGKTLLLLCDECEELLNIEAANPEVLPRLRRFFQQGEGVLTVITATRRLLQLETASSANTSPFLHGFTPPVFLRELDEAAATALVSRGNFAPEIVREICQTCHNHPYLLQQLAARFFESGDLPESIREMALDPTLGQFFAVDFAMLDDREKQVLRYILDESALSEADLVAKTALRSENVAAIVQALLQLGFVRRDGQRLQIANLFLEKWLLRESESLFAAPQVSSSGISGSGFTGRKIGHYRIETAIGRGGMGSVWRAIDERLQRTVALKILSPVLLNDPQAEARFRQEARAAAALNHPNIAQIFDIGVADELPFLALEFVAGGTLADWRNAHADDFSAKLSIAKQIADGLAHAHAQGVVHRDIKPENILVTATGQPKITDFGLAKIQDNASQLTQTGDSMGTPAYMAPEQVAGVSTDERTDIYSLGVVLFELFCGERPFAANAKAALVYSIMHESPKSACDIDPSLPRELCDLLAKMLQKSPDDRPQTIAAVFAQLNQLSG